MEFSSAWLEQVRDAVNGFEADGFELVWIDLSHTAPPHLPDFFDWHPLFAIERYGSPAGELSTAIHSVEERPLFRVGRLILRPEAQGRGFAGAFQQHLDRCLPALGFEAVRLDASGAGSYAWARLGYDFDLDAYRRLPRYRGLSEAEILHRVRTGLLNGPTPHEWPISEDCGGGSAPSSAPESVQVMLHRLSGLSEQHAELIADLERQLGSDEPAELQKPEGIALFGRGIELGGLPEGSWLGREVMIRSVWSGIRSLGLT